MDTYNKLCLLLISILLISGLSTAADLIVNGGSQTLTDGSYTYDDVEIKNGGTLYIEGKVEIKANYFLLSSQVQGNAESSDRCTSSPGMGDGDGGGYGGAGGPAHPPGLPARGSKTSNQILQGQPGKDGGDSCVNNNDGDPGRGGAALKVNASNIDVTGDIYVNGGNGISGGSGIGDTGGGGGSGGGVLLTGDSVAFAGYVEATGGGGGFGGAGGDGGEGGGGRFKIIACSISNSGSYDLSGHESGTFYSDTASTCNSAPSAPTNPEPSDGTTVTSSPVTLNAEFNDPDGDSGTIRFYDSSGSLIGSCSASDGNKCSSGVSWSISHGDNDWYAVAEDSKGATSSSSSTWTVIKNQPPQVDSLIRPDGTTLKGNDTVLRADVSDPNSGDTLTVTFYDNKTGTSIDSATVTGGGTVEGTWSSADLGGGDHKWWHVEVADSWETSKSTDNASFFVNALPTITDSDPQDGGFSGDDPVPLRIWATDKETTALNVYFYNDSDDMLIGKDTSFGGGMAEVLWSKPVVSNDYTWYVNVSDGTENFTSSDFDFKKLTSPDFRPTVNVENRYSSIIATLGDSSQFVFEVRNSIGTPKDLNTSLQGINATFLENDRFWITYSLDAQSSRRFQARINPDTTGDEELNITTTNTELGLSTTKSVPVYVRKDTAISTRNVVPGIGFLHLVIIVVAATVLYSFSL